MVDYNNILSALAQVRPGSTFLAIFGYKNKAGEVSDRVISFHMSYPSALRRSIHALESMGELSGVDEEARQELLASYTKSLAAPEEITGPYVSVSDSEGNPIRGVKCHEEKQTIYLYGLQVPNQKRILVPGTYKVVNKREKTIAKEKLTKDLPVSRFRQFILSPETLSEIRVQKMNLTF